MLEERRTSRPVKFVVCHVRPRDVPRLQNVASWGSKSRAPKRAFRPLPDVSISTKQTRPTKRAHGESRLGQENPQSWVMIVKGIAELLGCCGQDGFPHPQASSVLCTRVALKSELMHTMASKLQKIGTMAGAGALSSYKILSHAWLWMRRGARLFAFNLGLLRACCFNSDMAMRQKLLEHFEVEDQQSKAGSTLPLISNYSQLSTQLGSLRLTVQEYLGLERLFTHHLLETINNIVASMACMTFYIVTTGVCFGERIAFTSVGLA